MWMATRFDRMSARASGSSAMPFLSAKAMMGMDTVMPWLPLPLLDMAGSVQPAMRASEAAAVSPIA